MAEGEFALARQNLEKAAGMIGEWVGDHDLYAMLADTAARQYDAAALEKYAPMAETAAQRYKHLLYQGIARRALGVLDTLTGDLDLANERLNQALEVFHSLGTHWQIGRTLQNLGELELKRANIRLSEDFFERAESEFASMHAVPDLNRVKQALNGLRGR